MEIRDLLGQEIRDADEGKLYLERTLLIIPGASWMTDTLSTVILQVTQCKGIRPSMHYGETLTAEGNTLSTKVTEPSELIDKATTASDPMVRQSRQVTENTAAVVKAIQMASHSHHLGDTDQ